MMTTMTEPPRALPRSINPKDRQADTSLIRSNASAIQNTYFLGGNTALSSEPQHRDSKADRFEDDTVPRPLPGNDQNNHNLEPYTASNYHLSPVSPLEPPIGILSHDAEHVTTNAGSVEYPVSIRSVSSLGQQEETTPRNPQPPIVITEGSPTEETAQQVNFSRPKKPQASRIPVSKSSPPAKSTPGSQTLELPYSPARKGSVKGARDSLETLNIKKNRSSTASAAGSQTFSSPSPAVASPRVTSITSTPQALSSSRNVDKRRSTSDSRDLSRTNGRTGSGQLRQRTISGDSQGSPAQRRRLSSARKNPINRPEGDPPWLGSMFKPDPMLPPEQQMLPTVAKRLAIEQGLYVPPPEGYGELPYPEPQSQIEAQTTAGISEPQDKEERIQRTSSFRNLLRRVSQRSKRSEEGTIPQQQPPLPSTMQQQPEQSEWPLRTPSLKHEEDDVFAQSLSREDNLHHFDGQTSAVPPITTNVESPPKLAITIPSSTVPSNAKPAASSQSVNATTTTAASSPPDLAARVPQVPLKQEKEKSCGCCAVM